MRVMVRTHLDDEWKQWIWHNIGRGCDKDDIFQIMLDHGFGYELIRNELSHELRPPTELTNPPFASTQQCDRAAELRLTYFPNAKRHPSPFIELYSVDDFLNEQECQKLIELTKTRLMPSTHTNKDEPDKYYRTSSTCHMGQLGDPLVRDVDRRICAFLGINPSFGEDLQAQYYQPNEEFKAHTDAFAPNTPEFQHYAAHQGQRVWTAMIYLNDVSKGGETEFPNIGSTFVPKRGQMLIWKNIYPNGQPNNYTQHRGLPVIEGYKTILTKWIRERTAGVMHTKQSREYIPGYTPTGFMKTNIPPALFQMLKAHQDIHADQAVEEYVPGGFLQNPGAHPSHMIHMPPTMRTEILDSMLPVCEQWCGTELEPVRTYGIRRYVRGTTLRPHADTKSSHVISATLTIDQKVDEPWPLQIEDHYYRRHEVVLEPGEMLLYEGARLVHGRPTPLAGDYYNNAFVHYRPKGFNANP